MKCSETKTWKCKIIYQIVQVLNLDHYHQLHYTGAFTPALTDIHVCLVRLFKLLNLKGLPSQNNILGYFFAKKVIG